MDMVTMMVIFSASHFAGMILAREGGLRLGRRHIAAHPDEAGEGRGPIEGAIFALLGLLIAFSFSGAASRFEGRRALILKEANAIGTAYLRVDLARPEAQPALRDLFRRYADARVQAYRLFANRKDAAGAEAFRQLDVATALQGDLWASAVTGTAGQGPAVGMLLGPLNDMFDIFTERRAALSVHPPLPIFGLLAFLSLVCAALAGFGQARGKSGGRLHGIAFAAIVAGVTYVILDLEFPRVGLIRIDAADALIQQAREAMK